LRRRVAAGDLQAHFELGLELRDGIQDIRGRTIVRRNAVYAVRLLRAAAQGGISEAYDSLAYAYDVGLGVRANRAEAERWYRRAYRSGSSMCAGSLAIIYRDAGDLRSAFRWYRRAAALKDGDAMVDVAYCYQYGIGVRKNVLAAQRVYRSAMSSRDITAYGREEAMYGLAVSFVDTGQNARAVPLLKAASADGDYTEAEAVLEQIRGKKAADACRRWRFLRKNLLGHATCGVHKTPGRHRPILRHRAS
jgi:TPR repeat protein